MNIEDKDLLSIQEARNLIKNAKKAQNVFSKYSMAEIDNIVESISKSASREGEYLAKLAHTETKFGNWQDKLQKNKFASDRVYEYVKDMKTLGIIGEQYKDKIMDIGIPVGVISALIPSTNPTSTTIYKTLISLKAGNSIIFSPHPAALNSIKRTVQILNSAAVQSGAPEGLISCLSNPTKEATEELMRHKDVNLILATGGSAMVKAAYSSGTPALGVGPGNVPVFIERSADIKSAVKKIFEGKTFDNGTVCSSEQSIITEKVIEEQVKDEIIRQGGYFLKGDKLNKIIQLMEHPSGRINPKIVGKTAADLAKMANIEIPGETKVLLCEEKGVGRDYPFSKEKLTSLLAFYSVENFEEASQLCILLLEYGGLGHTISIHSKNEEIIKEFALQQPASRIVVNTPSSIGAIGYTTKLAPSLTLGSGAIGGSATSDNISPMNLINIRKLAYGIDEVAGNIKSADSIDINTITKMVLEEIKKINIK